MKLKGDLKVKRKSTAEFDQVRELGYMTGVLATLAFIVVGTVRLFGGKE